MTDTTQAIAMLVAKDAIRELAMLYSRAIDRKDVALLRTLYTEDATDTHGTSYDGPAAGYCDFIAGSVPYMRYSGHHICNHLISVDGDSGEGEIYALAYHVIPNRAGGWMEDVRFCRYIDRYRHCDDGRWRFSKRVVTYDHHAVRPLDIEDAAVSDGSDDASYATLATRLFARGERA